jgi:hypothetical protein
MRIQLLCSVTLLLCQLLLPATGQSQLRKIYLHPKTVAREKQSKFIDSIRFIPLEIKDGILLGAYYNIEVTRNYLMLTDYLNKRFLLFSKEGKFVKDISYGKLGGNFYPAYEERNNRISFFGNNKNYALTAKDQVKIKLDWEKPRNRKYFKKYTLDLNDSALTIKKAIPDKHDIIRVYHLYDDYYLRGQISTSPLYKDSVDHEIKIYKNDHLVNSFFPYNRINEPRFLYAEENVGFSKTDTPYVHFITRPYCDTIYRLTKDILSPAYKLVLPLENSLPSTFFTRSFKNKTDWENFKRNNGWMLRQVHSFYETPQFIYFLVGYLSNFDSYIYEKQTNLTYKTKNIRSDSTQYNMQLFGDFSLTRKGDRFYKSQKAGDLLAFFDKNKNVAMPGELEAFLKSKPPASTPIIVEFKFKNQL